MRKLAFLTLSLLLLGISGCGDKNNSNNSTSDEADNIINGNPGSGSGSTAESCSSLSSEFNSLADAGRACVTKDDCSYAPLGNANYSLNYGIGGILIGNNANLTKLIQILDQYLADSCIPQSPISCMAIVEPQCINNQCTGGGCGEIVNLN